MSHSFRFSVQQCALAGRVALATILLSAAGAMTPMSGFAQAPGSGTSGPGSIPAATAVQPEAAEGEIVPENAPASIATSGAPDAPGSESSGAETTSGPAATQSQPAEVQQPAPAAPAPAAPAGVYGEATGAASIATPAAPIPPAATSRPAASIPRTPEAITKRVAASTKSWGKVYGDRMALFLKDNPTRPKGRAVMIGDSITQGLPIETALGRDAVINRGIGGDRIPGLRARLDVCVDDLEPADIFLLIGINDIASGKGGSVAQMKRSYEELIDDLRGRAPNARLHVFSVFPVGMGRSNLQPTVDSVNEALRDVCTARNIEYLDVAAVMKNEAGYIRQEFTQDSIHMTVRGNIAWMETFVPAEHWGEIAVNLGKTILSVNAGSRLVDKTDPNRDGAEFPSNRSTNELVLYTPHGGFPRSGTNQWGTEAVVRGGRVVEVGKQNDNEIPADGYVVSGHGTGAEWISTHLKPGTVVQVVQGRLQVITPDQSAPKHPLAQLERMRDLLLVKVAEAGAKASLTDVEALKFVVAARQKAIAAGVTDSPELRDAVERNRTLIASQ